MGCLWRKIFVWCGIFPCSVFAQEPDRSALVNQCSAIREVIFSAHEKQFANLTDKELRGSHGYQVRGNWRFESVQYASLLAWPLAAKSYIDYSEETEGGNTRIVRQFVAEFGPFFTADAARRQFEMLNGQIADCRVMLNDTSIVLLKVLPLERIRDDLPVAALDARLYPVRIKDAEAAAPGQEVVIMTAWEKNDKQYTAYMIVEYRLQQGLLPLAR